MMNCFCANHPSVKAETAITLPELASPELPAYGARKMLFLCLPCTLEYRRGNATAYKGKREAWETDLNMERDSQRARYGYSDWDSADEYSRSLERRYK